MLNNEIEEIKEKINKSDYVSFDIFDTLVFRNVLYPVDIFRIMDNVIYEKYDIKGFSKIRIESEAKTRLVSSKEDITLDEIYDTINKKLGKVSKSLQKLELELENKYITLNSFMKEIFDFAIKSEKKIYIISDMYLSSKFLIEKLKDLGYTGYQKLYVSCEQNATKASGSIYQLVKEENNIKDTSKWLHIGDNVLSDIQNAKSKGIDTYYYKPPRDRVELFDAKSSIQESIITAININQVYNGYEIDALEKLGKIGISPIFYGFCDWLSKMTYSQDMIIFLSRDGYFPKKVFELIKEKRKLKTKTKYLYTSRKAYQIPSYVLIPKKEAIEQLTLWNSDLNHKLKIKDIYKQVGLDSKKFEKEISSMGLKSDEEVLTIQNREKVKKLISLTFGDIKNVLEEKLMLVKEYLVDEGLNDFKQINVMDIGWRGSVQYSMQKILEKDINGFYFGTTENLYEEVRINSFGYFFDAGLPFENKQFVVDNIMMFELIFNSSEKSLVGFKRNDEGVVIPEFSNKENTYKNELSKIQQSALESIEKIIEYDEYLTGISSKVCLKNYINFIKNKNYEDMVAFKKLSNDVGVNDDDSKYVVSISKEDFLKKRESALKKVKYSLWKDAYVIEGIDTEKELEEFYKKNNIKYKKKKVKNSQKVTIMQKIISIPYSIYYGTKNKFKRVKK